MRENGYKSEAEVAAVVVQCLENAGWEVFQEVALKIGPVLDIVGRKNGLLWIIEVKKQFSLNLLEQGWDRMKMGNWVSVAYPGMRADGGFIFQACRTLGLGLISVNYPWSGSTPDLKRDWRRNYPPCRTNYIGGRINLQVPPKFNPNPWHNFDSRLNPEKANFCPAGSAGGGHWTPFRQTMTEVRAFLDKNGPSTVGEIVKGIKHHYASDAGAKTAIPQWVEAGSCPGVRVDRETKPMRLEVFDVDGKSGDGNP